MDNSASIEATISSIASKGMGGGSVASVAGWFTGNNMLTLVGVGFTLLGFVVNFIFRLRKDSRDKRECSVRLELQWEEEERRRELHALSVAALRANGKIH